VSKSLILLEVDRHVVKFSLNFYFSLWDRLLCYSLMIFTLAC